jgi:hypothetical protein
MHPAPPSIQFYSFLFLIHPALILQGLQRDQSFVHGTLTHQFVNDLHHFQAWQYNSLFSALIDRLLNPFWTALIALTEATPDLPGRCSNSTPNELS